MILKNLLLLAAFVFLGSIPAEAGNYYGTPKPSPVLMHLVGTVTIDGSAANAGDEISVIDGSAKTVGHFVVKEPGLFGDLAIYGDSELTTRDEGAVTNEALQIKIYQASSDREFSGTWIRLHRPRAAGAIYTPYPKGVLRFEGEGFYLLNIVAGE